MDPLNILIAPGPYKECMSSFDVADAMRRGVLDVLPNANIFLRPLSDGGSGIARVLTEVTSGKLIEKKVHGPLGDYVDAHVGILGDGKTAIIESAQAAGLTLIPLEKRNPLLTSSYGVGELILSAVELGATSIIIGCGDSGTNDCGIGCASALGVNFYSGNGDQIKGRLAGKDLINITSIDYASAKERLKNIEIIVACNLTSILCGPDGTSIIYGPQKGATPNQVDILHQNVQAYVDLIYKLDKLDMAFVPGAGAAGGLASSLYAFFGAKLLYSIDIVDRYINLDQYLSQSDIVITGEGKIDDRTATGKIVCGVALKAKKYNLPVIAIVGSIAHDHEDIFYNGVDAVEPIADGPMQIEESIKNADSLIKDATSRVMRFVLLINKNNSQVKIN